ncbi:hypothetical protein [Tautonia plasticadhaerens]|uniref:Peptidoglycan binding domain protein n=1 Tax=Tautonia plasticadhaerens TaxID=2527974 RepID=A0A518HC68_9BACT|nr:hypothetical protein [Tautonia plasticadhaerens]QDV38439.1 hypothetical protein ElP_63940 [Tautonia plasticadhaerens]
MAWHCGAAGCPTHSSPEHNCRDWEMAPLRRSVGRGGANDQADVRVVQGTLNRFQTDRGGPSPRLDTSGRCDAPTIAAIEALQRLHPGLGLRSPDGRVDVGGRTHAALASRFGGTLSSPSPTSTPAAGPISGTLTPQHIPITVHEQVIDFFVCISTPDPETKVRLLATFFGRMPPAHLAVLYPFFVIEDKPNHGPGGGTWLRAELEAGAFAGRRHEEATGLSNADVDRLVLSAGARGLHGIPRDRWERDVGTSAARAEWTVIHEAGHAVDYELDLRGTYRVHDYRGITPACGAGNLIVRRAVEAYARYIYADRDAAVARESVPSETRAASSSRVIRNLWGTPAFSPANVPPGWRPRSSGNLY